MILRRRPAAAASGSSWWRWWQHRSRLAYGPTNLHAFADIAPAIAGTLPTAPQNIKPMRNSDVEWWTKNRVAVTERFNTWVIG